MNPDSVMFSNNPVESVPAESEMVIFRSELQDYNPSSNRFIRINLPVADKGWIDFSDTVLSMNLYNRSFQTDGANATKTEVKTRLGNLIKSITVLNSQNEQVEYINNYNVINAVMDDYSYGEEHRSSVECILSGGSPSGLPSDADAIAGQSTSTGQADGGNIVLCDKIMTGFTSGQFLLPLGYLVGGVCSIVLELEIPETALTVTGTGNDANTKPAYRVADVELRAKQIIFGDLFNQQFEATLAEAGGVGINYITETYLHNQNTIQSGVSSQQNLTYSVNPRSAKYMLCVHRNEADIELSTAFSVEDRCNANINQYNWEINGRMRPTQPISVNKNNISQSFSAVLDAFGQIGSINRNTMVSKDQDATGYYRQASTSLASNDGFASSKFITALPLEDFNSASNASVYSGLSLVNAGTISYRPRLGATTNKTYRVDIFTSCDISIHFTLDGRMYSVK